uniref:Cytochrome b n=1 Tax=Schistosoma haematobium TaxID=6185 RepID=Q1I0P2_SCHHA|nr:cytochrome b [Schistosoma haematobium]AAZ57309.1 cytochrome b [Schistosoma haematobium]
MWKLVCNNLIDLPTSLGLSYLWCIGFVLSVFMIIQVITGIILSMFYNSFNNFCFIVWADDNFIYWMVRYLHIWGVSVIFVLLYIHICRGLYYSSYSKVLIWSSGFILYLLVMVEAFLGYVLPWHQMSYWAATVLTSIVLSVPIFGSSIYSYIVGGYSVTVNETLVRFFSVHIILGIGLLGLIMLHLFYLHKTGSSVPLFLYSSYSDNVYFHKYYTIKDFFVFMFILMILFMFVISSPNLVLDCEAFTEANLLVTPSNIKPEWYFLGYYAILRSINSKLGGLVFVLVILFVIWVPNNNYSCIYSFSRQLVFWFIVSLGVQLSYIGACHAEYPYGLVSQVSSIIFLCFLVIYKMFWLVPFSCDKVAEIF